MGHRTRMSQKKWMRQCIRTNQPVECNKASEWVKHQECPCSPSNPSEPRSHHMGGNQTLRYNSFFEWIKNVEWVAFWQCSISQNGLLTFNISSLMLTHSLPLFHHVSMVRSLTILHSSWWLALGGYFITSNGSLRPSGCLLYHDSFLNFFPLHGLTRSLDISHCVAWLTRSLYSIQQRGWLACAIASSNLAGSFIFSHHHIWLVALPFYSIMYSGLFSG